MKTNAMFSVEACSLPDDALLRRYYKKGAYTDCYTTEISAAVTQSQYVFAFYTSPLFKIERVILKIIVARPSNDLQVQELAEGAVETFAAWRVEARSENQLLLADFQGRTRSWLMTEGIDERRTRLYFGSAVLPVKMVPVENHREGASTLGTGFNAMLGFHKIYSELLLSSARVSLEKRF